MASRRVQLAVLTTCLALRFGSSSGWAVARQAPGDTIGQGTKSAQWTLVSSTPVDPRIEAQVRQLAGENQARIAVFKSQAQALRLHPALVIELARATNGRTFERSFRRAQPAPGPEAIREAFRLDVHCMTAPGPTEPSRFEPRRARLLATGPEGFHYALNRLSRLLSAAGNVGNLDPKPKSVLVTRMGRSSHIDIADFPSFGARGVVEGFYGTPWSHQDRLDVLRFEGQHGMNVYYYAPKDDPYHREQWRDPYPPDRMAELGDLVAAARANFVDFCFAVSPGLSMTYSSDEDFAALAAKLDSVGKLGTSCFALFLDDVPEQIRNPADKARFKTLAEAHAFVIDKLYRHLIALSPQNHLTVTPTTYTNGFGSREYIRELGAAVDPHVDLVWTGTQVVSPVITVEQTRDWSKLLRRPPLVWDNYPVNDYRRWRPFLGPLRGRDANLYQAVRGLVSNPMNEAHASMIALATVADYLWSPQAYNPEAAEQQALTAQFGKEGPQLLAPLIEAWGDYGWQENLFQPLWSPGRLPIDLPGMEHRLAAIDSALQATSSGPASDQPALEKLETEIAPFAQKTRERAEALAADPGFRRLSDGKLQWNEDYDVLTASALAAAPALDGDFAKWESGKVYSFKPLPPRAGTASQAAPNSATPALDFGGRFALGWDNQYLYVGIDVRDPQIHFAERQTSPSGDNSGSGISRGDTVTLVLETAFRQDYYATKAGPDALTLFLSPGNFDDAPAMHIRGSNLSPRFANYEQEIKMVWKKTSLGYSGDVAVPRTFFAGSDLREGYEIGVAISAQKEIPAGSTAGDEASLQHLRLTSKRDSLVPVNFGDPATYQRLVLAGGL